MGVCSSNRASSHHLEVVNPTDQDHAAIENQYGGHLDPNHALNINQKYKFLYTVDPTVTTGKGMKKTFGYISKSNLEVILKKRIEFWETRVEGKAETWNALKMACDDEDFETALEVMKALQIKLIQKTLQMSYDVHGYRYDIPIFVINNPTSYEKADEPKKAVSNKELSVFDL